VKLLRIGETTLEIIDGSITDLAVDAIVNAANARMLGGGGVDGAIHAAAGPQLREAAAAYPELRPGVRCEVGQVKVTAGFLLPSRHVLHTVGPIWWGGQHGEPEQLASCYRNSLALVSPLELRSIAFPAISAGVYGYPNDEAAEIAVGEVVEFAKGHDRTLRVVFSCFGAEMVQHYEDALGRSE
jgi:O-acetyl-ADP-ribose deacetylase (regulator of RNase III)